MAELNIALYQPEIAGNVGTIIRNCACFGANLHIIEPCGFPFDIRKVKKSALDYYDKIKIIRHDSFESFLEKEISQKNKHLILATTKGTKDVVNFQFKTQDVILFGQESAGVPTHVRDKCHEEIFIKMQNNSRSLNIAVACGIFLSHANAKVASIIDA